MSSTTIGDRRFEKYISVAEAARIVGTTTQAMSNLARKGSFTTRIVGGRVLILRSEVESFVPRPKGRPTKKGTTAVWRSKKAPEVDIENQGEYVSQAEAARIRGISKQGIANLIRRNRLRSVIVAGRRLVIRAEVEEFVPQPVGRPLKNMQRSTGRALKHKTKHK